MKTVFTDTSSPDLPYSISTWMKNVIHWIILGLWKGDLALSFAVLKIIHPVIDTRMILGTVVYLFVPQQRTKYYLAPLDSIALPLCSVWMQLAFCKGNFSKNVFSRFLLRNICFWLKRSGFLCVYDMNLAFFEFNLMVWTVLESQPEKEQN